MRGTHLDNGNIVIGRQAEQRLGHAHVVVVVALGMHDMVAACKNGRDKLFCRCLAVGAGDADNRYGKMAAVLARQLLIGCQTVVNKKMTAVGNVIFLLVDNGK